VSLGQTISCGVYMYSKRLFISVFALFFTAQAFADLLRVSPEWLKSKLNDKDLIILDSRSAEEYADNHIAGAISFPDSLTYQQKTIGGEIVEPDIMQRLLRERGIDYGKTILVYDAGQLMDASRVFWALEVYGLKNVKILNSGFKHWDSKNYPISAEVPAIKPSNYVVSIDHRRIASKFSTQLATVNPNQIIVDARPADNYAGKKSTAKRFGHIPTAINIPIYEHFEMKDGERTLHGLEKLKQLYTQLPQGSKIVTYCEYGRASSTVYLTLRELGYDVSNYDASWREWANDLSLPIEK